MIGQALAASCRTRVGRDVTALGGRPSEMGLTATSVVTIMVANRRVMLSSKLTVGVHILTVLALTPDQAQTSEYIAGSVNTNPVVIRRLLGEAPRGRGRRVPRGDRRRLAASRFPPGESRSWMCSGRSSRRARRLLCTGASPTRTAGWVGTSRASFTAVYREVERRMDEQLAKTSIAGILGSVRKRERA